MLFLGTEKFPDENEYNQYLNKHGGSSNAYTDMESTNYYFDCSSDQLEGALDRFSQFFIAPLFTPSATDRELNAVNSEHEKNLQNDMWRSFQLSKALCRPDHPFAKFGSGNKETLGEGPKEAGIDLRAELLSFHEKYYSANVMKLVVLGKESIDELEKLVETYFSPIENKNISTPVFPGKPYGPEQLAKRVSVIPVKEMRAVELNFPMREIESLYKQKPARYISHLIGHEGKGSILSLLRELGWANDLSAGEARSCTDWSSFSIHIDLTDDGLEHVDDVVEVVFAYISLLKKAGPQQWVHDETATVADMSFRFLSKRQPIDYATSVASSMQLFASEHILAGPYRIYDYGPSAIAECMEYLTPKNMLLTVTARSFEGMTDSKEKWYGTDYKLEDIPTGLLERWGAATVDSGPIGGRLEFPERNDMIASNFDLKNVEFPKDECRLLQDTPTLRCWYKPDNVFDMPKANIMAILQTPLATESPDASVLSSLFVNVLNEHTTEFTYLASMASLHCSFSVARKGIEIHCSGYNHKQAVLVGRILDAINALADRLEESLLERMKDKIEKSYLSFTFAQPYQHAIYGADLCFETSKWKIEDKLAALKRVTLDDMRNFSRRLLSSFRLEMLIHGNCTPEEAMAIGELYIEKLQPTEPCEATLPAIRVTQLENKKDYYYRFVEFNEEDNNSALVSVYQMGPMDLATNSILAFLHHLVKEPAFNELRTNEQLGYIVHTSIKTSGDNIKGLLFLIQSDGYDPNHLDERVEAFLVRFRTRLVEMEAEEFDTNIQAVKKNFLEKNKNLGEESSKYWSVIGEKSYIFRKWTIIGEEVGKITKDRTIDFFDKFIAAGGPCRSKFAAQVCAKQHESALAAPVPDGGVLITDPQTFQCEMPLFPLRSTVDVTNLKLKPGD
jgi:insulysin